VKGCEGRERVARPRLEYKTWQGLARSCGERPREARTWHEVMIMAKYWWVEERQRGASAVWWEGLAGEQEAEERRPSAA